MEYLIELIADFSWRQPSWLWALLWPFMWASYQAWWLRRQQTDYAEASLWPWVMASNCRHASRFGVFNIGWLGLAWLCLVLALAGPRLAEQVPQADQRAGVDVLVLLDASRSMSAEDVKPSRFGLAQHLIESLSGRLAEGDRIGLMAYAGQAHWVTPLTEDRVLFNRALHLITAEFLPLAGSQTFDALDFAQQQLAAVKRAPAMILLVTDGGGLQNTAADQTALKQMLQNLSSQGISLNLLGVGTSANAMLSDVLHPSGWLHDNNQPVTVPLARGELQALAQQTGGSYFEASADLALIENLLNAIKNLAEPLENNQTYTEYQDFAAWFMALALLILVWRLSFGSIGFAQRNGRVKSSASSTTTMLIVLAFSGTITSTHSDQAWSQTASDIETRAYQTFQQANYAEAENLYRELGGFNGQLGAGNAAYRQTQYERAIIWYRQALLLADNDQQRAQALFNLGNSYMQVGLAAFALEAYADAQTYQSPFEKAAHNQALAQGELAQQLAEREAAEAERKGEGSRKHLEGSFHGGQKPDPNNTAGSGAEGESDDGRSDGVAQSIPTERFQGLLNPNTQTDWAINADSKTAVSIKNWAQQRRLEQLQQQLQTLADDQQGLLKHLFEREAGFQAKQDEVRVIPGVEPW